jgi:SNF2 family DNA or RNA helicase
MADDMGLGKTLQILYFIDWHSRKYTNHKPYLIVAPVSLLENWENEYDRFFMAPRLSINRLTSKDVPRQFSKDIVDRMQKMDIVLTNYESLRISQLNFCAVEFDIVALDEAQKIKSPGTLVTNAAKALKSNFKIAMTGTPVENTLLDLWCIMDFCVPGLLGNAKAFAAQYQNPLKKEDTDIVALGNEVHEKLGIYFLRRLKKDAAKDLPQKLEFKQPIEMPSVQKDVYRGIINDYVVGKQPNMLLTIMDIREVSEHPYLYDSTLANHRTDELVDTSARLQATIAFLDRIQAKNEKVIIFAERKETQKMLQRICHERYGIVTKIINGDTPSIVTRQAANRQSRQSSIDDFQSVDGFNVIIMSPVAAGMGLNVTAANHVIHYSRHWNPAKENQATDRAYRIGQTKDVYVYYPMAVSGDFKSFDETLDELLSRKTSLATSTIFPTERVEVKTEELGQMLFGV